MIIDHYRAELVRLGVPPRHPQVLKILPAVAVAWAGGGVDRLQRLRLRRLARDRLGVGDEGEAVLQEWLGAPPPPDVVEAGLRLLRALAHAPDDDSVEADELAGIVTACEWVARSRSADPDTVWAPSATEDAAILTVASALGVDLGRPWSALWRELDVAPREVDPPSVSIPLSLEPASRATP